LRGGRDGSRIHDLR